MSPEEDFWRDWRETFGMSQQPDWDQINGVVRNRNAERATHERIRQGLQDMTDPRTNPAERIRQSMPDDNEMLERSRQIADLRWGVDQTERHQTSRLSSYLRHQLRRMAYRTRRFDVSNDEVEMATAQNLARLFVLLGMGEMRLTDGGLERLLQVAGDRIMALTAENQAARRPAVEYRDVMVDSHPRAHDHHVQFRIMDTEDRVLASSEWVKEYDASRLEGQFRDRLRIAQMDGKDVFMNRYHRCNHVNLTTKVDREGDQ